ncbi:bifunctional Gfo/Idh/MocA family oxidoreductase/class I SAM-dependent methyltransferase [Sorangium sp. So ce341]|uniref:bifunctional Gfo/Idh/MocA family oxidoreductase/class I SAM-dependent methyltransferase n=1 Tax=Sorangium sp. So ce341 TaxID=3133302 RepID=UPI003F5E7F8A
MTAAIPLVLCGAGFGPLHLGALQRLNGRFHLIGQLAGDSEEARMFVDQARIALWTRPEQLPVGPGVSCWVSATGHGVPVAERVIELLRRGSAVLAEAPLEHDELTACMRQARLARAAFRLAAVASATPSSRRFLGAAQALRERTPIRYIAATCTRASIQALLRLTGDALGALRPWQIREPMQLASGLVVLGGSLAGTPLVLRVRNEVPSETPMDAEIVVGSDAGELRLAGVHGQVIWTAHATGAGVLFGGPDAPAERETVSWLRATSRELTTFADAMESPGAAVSEAQVQLTLCRLRHDVLAALGAATARAGAEVFPIADLAAAAVEAAADDADRAAPDAPTSEEVHEAGLRLSGLLERASGSDALAHLPGAMQRLEAICLRAIWELLLASGAVDPGGEARTAEEIVGALGAAPRHAWLVRRWLAALTDQGVLSNTADRYAWRRALRDAGAAADLPDAYAALGFPPAMAEVHQAALRRLHQLVRDEVSIQQLLFGDRQDLSAVAAYQDNIFTAYLCAAGAHLVRRCAELRYRSLRVLELGGGAGLATAAALRALDGAPVDYLFTDISRAFTVAAQERFGNHRGMRYATLDINADFAAQGVEPHAADVVLAGNVLHNAVHVGRTLRRIRRALAPGGWLIFTDSTRDNHAILTAMQFLLSPPAGSPPLGSEDRRAGTDQVFVDAPGWNAELMAAAFVPRFVLPSLDSPLAVAGQHLFFATAC